MTDREQNTATCKNVAIEAEGKDGGYTAAPFAATDLLSGRELADGERIEMNAYDGIFAKKKE